MTTKVRKKVRTFSELSEKDKWNLLSSYSSDPTIPLSDLANEYNITIESMNKAIDRFYNSFVQAKETKLLITEQQLEQNQDKRKGEIIYYKKFNHPSTMNEKFLSLLGEGDECSEAEHTYAYTYIFTGNNERALKESHLDIGLSRDQGTNSKAILKVRGYFLRSLPRVKKLIEDLRSSKLEDIIIDKAMVQSELVDLLYQLKEEGSPTTVNQRLRIIEDLAKTCGAMSERIEVQNVDPSSALDILIMKAKEAEVKEPDLIEVID
jgi:hypothetical protein